MKLYQTPGGTWAGTEKNWTTAAKAEGVDVKSYTGRRTVDVPTDKAGLLEFLQFHNVNVIAPRELGDPAAQQSPQPPAAPPAPGADPETTAVITLSRMDNPGVDVDGIVETIGRSSGYALKRYAGAVAVAFQLLSSED